MINKYICCKGKFYKILKKKKIWKRILLLLFLFICIEFLFHNIFSYKEKHCCLPETHII